MAPRNSATAREIAALRKTLRTLRKPGGCPWDREQDLDDMISYLIEESYELLQAEKAKDSSAIEEELGDVFFILIFIHELMLERRSTPLSKIVSRVHRKIINRHPHVFGSTKAANSGESLAEWERIKRSEKRKRATSRVLEGVPDKLPPLRRAMAVQRKAAGVGFDWPDHGGILDKLQEEIGELKREIRRGKRARIKDEIGDILFTVVNLARRLKVDPESVLEGTTAKFITRFGEVERQAKHNGRDLSSMSLEEMEKLWQESKRKK
ncbi:MAG: nucleoside triphosphate pyrophosphohydrolase [Candidatus Krumholzibacteria bacterium]|nr:nucleoside triphosphate pyrophosphohydrolase [Candidatus Krumholzibacteria bacterium]